MSVGTVLAIAVPVLVVLAVIAFATTVRRREGSTVSSLTREARRADRSAAGVPATPDVEAEAKERYATARTAPTPAAITPPPPRDPEEVGITRRQLFNRGLLATATVGLSSLGAGILAFLWPSGAGGFGSVIKAGKLSDVTDYIKSNKAPFYVPEAKSYLTPYPKSDLPKAKKVYDSRILPGMEAGLVALYQKCPHLGCRVPWCQTSQWFECPCHGSKYNRVGEKRGGPAPRGMDRFPIQINGDLLSIDTGQVVVGPEIGVDTTGQTPEGPHCV